jgi:hypothetical protein
MLADILGSHVDDRRERMAKSKDKSQVAIETVGPYVKRAMEDPALREDLLAAFIAARSLYGKIQKGSGVKGKAERVTDKRFQKDLQDLVAELQVASDRLQGKKKKSHKARNRVVLLTGVTLGVLYNPWTGESTREWIMSRIAGENGNGLDDLGRDLADDITDKAESAADSIESVTES